MSIRAGIFRKILHYIDKSDWRDYGEFIVFGEEAFQAMGTHNHMEEERQDKRVSEEIDRIVAEVARQQGSSLAAERTSMDGPRPLDLSILLKGCSPETLTAFQNARERMLRDQKAVSSGTPTQGPSMSLTVITQRKSYRSLNELFDLLPHLTPSKRSVRPPRRWASILKRCITACYTIFQLRVRSCAELS